MLVLLPELIYTINICLHRSCDNIGVGSETIIDVSVILNLHMHLSHIVRTLRYSLNSEFLQCHLTIDDFLECLDGRIHRMVPVAAASKCSLAIANPMEATLFTPMPVVT